MFCLSGLWPESSCLVRRSARHELWRGNEVIEVPPDDFLDDDSRMEVTLVFPADADIDAGKLSVLSPVGTALLGYAEGDTVEWEVPAGKRRIRIEKILYQPEAAGDFGS